MGYLAHGPYVSPGGACVVSSGLHRARPATDANPIARLAPPPGHLHAHAR